MKSTLNLAVATALFALSGIAVAQSAAVNPFSRPAPPPAPVIAHAAPVEVATPEPEPVKDEPPVLLEEISASRIGIVNGKYFFRGEGTYLFEDSQGRELIRKVQSSSTTPQDGTQEANAPARPRSAPTRNAPSRSSAPPKPLPSMVGKPAPTN